MRRGSGGGCGWGSGLLPRWSLRRFLLDSPLVGRRLAHTVLDQGEPRQRSNVPEQSHSKHQTTVELFAEDDEGEVLECPLCLTSVPSPGMVRLAWCSHRCCESCLRQYLAIEIFEARVPVNCPVCHENMHPSDVRRIVDNPILYEKYEEFSVRRALAADPDTRWCPAPDCNYAVVARGCASCPKLTCQAAGCGASFCYHCKAAWHPTQTCDAARRERQPPPPPPPQHSRLDLDQGEVKPCPRCSVLIVKVEDGSCNHMVCCVCGAEFCWLCMKEVSDLHYLSPSGCTFWGKKPWSRKKKLLWQLGTLAGAPLGIAVVAGVALPALLVGLPLWAGRRAHRRLRRATPARRRAATALSVATALVVSPLVAGLAVGIGVPILLFYVYGVVPVSLCRAGGCGGSDRDPDPPPPHLHDDVASRKLEPSIGDASLSAGSAAGTVGGGGSTGAGAASLAGLAGSLGGPEPSISGVDPSLGGPEPSIGGRDVSLGGREPSLTGREPSLTEREPSLSGREPSLGGKEPSLGGEEPSSSARRLEVRVDVSAPARADEALASSPPASASASARSALLKSLFLYGSPLPPADAAPPPPLLTAVVTDPPAPPSDAS